MAIRTDTVEARRAAEREVRVNDLTKRIIHELLYGVGTLGERMRLSLVPQPEEGEHPLSQMLLDRLKHVEGYDLFVRTYNFTKRVMPVEHFLREDGKTPHLRHVDRATHLFLDLLPKDTPPLEKIIRASIVVGHDSVEEPHERGLKNEEKGLPLEDRGGMTLKQIRIAFDEEMEGLDPALHDAAEEVYAGILLFDSALYDSDYDYLEALRVAGYSVEKLIDRGNESLHGDLSRTARTLESALHHPGELSSLDDNLEARYKRNDRSIAKASAPKLAELARETPDAVQEYWEATIRTGRGFKNAIEERLARENPTVFDRATLPHPRAEIGAPKPV